MKSWLTLQRLSFVLFLLLTPLVFSAPAAAHQTAMSTLNAEIRPESREVDLLLAVSATDLGSFLRLDSHGEGFANEAERKRAEPQMALYLNANLRVENDDAVCSTRKAGLVQPERPMTALFYRKTLECAAPLGAVTIHNHVLLKDVGGYTHYGRIQLGEDIHTTVFNPDAPSYTVEVVSGGAAAAELAEQPLSEVFSTFIWQGTLHIWEGLDHVLFVICLLLAAGNFRRLLLVVTCFTVAHSITLGLSALDILTLAPEVVEPLIALSIAWVAAEIIIAQRRLGGVSGAEQANSVATSSEDGGRFSLPSAAGKHLFAVTFLFGLLHGFGFSYVLRDELQLPTGALLPALFAFNLGVELGQIAVVCVAFPLVIWMRNRSWASRGIQAVSALVLALSLYWIVVRIFFPALA